MKLIILSTFILLTYTSSFSQSVSRQSIGSLGISSKLGSYTIHQSTGQPYQTINNTKSATLGFVQPMHTIQLKPVGNSIIQIKVYPNPTENSISFDIENNLENVSVSIVDITGKIILNDFYSQLNNNFVLDCSQFENGTYFISIIDDSRNKYQSKLVKI